MTLASDVTTIQDDSDGLVITSVTNTPQAEALDVVSDTTVDSLLGAVKPYESPLQYYKIYNASIPRVMGKVVTGDVLEVIAEDKQTTAEYAITVA